jgi:hypothetical protein
MQLLPVIRYIYLWLFKPYVSIPYFISIILLYDFFSTCPSSYWPISSPFMPIPIHIIVLLSIGLLLIRHCMLCLLLYRTDMLCLLLLLMTQYSTVQYGTNNIQYAIPCFSLSLSSTVHNLWTYPIACTVCLYVHVPICLPSLTRNDNNSSTYHILHSSMMNS